MAPHIHSFASMPQIQKGHRMGFVLLINKQAFFYEGNWLKRNHWHCKSQNNEWNLNLCVQIHQMVAKRRRQRLGARKFQMQSYFQSTLGWLSTWAWNRRGQVKIEMVWFVRHLSSNKKYTVHYLLLVFESISYYPSVCCYCLVHNLIHSICFCYSRTWSFNNHTRSCSNKAQSEKIKKDGQLLDGSLGDLRWKMGRNKIEILGTRRCYWSSLKR